MAEVIGKARFHNFKEFRKWIDSKEGVEFYTVKNLWTNGLYTLQGKFEGIRLGDIRIQPDWQFKRLFDEDIPQYESYIDTIYGQEFRDGNVYPYDLYYRCDKFCLLGYANTYFVVPNSESAIVVEKLVDYNGFSLSQLKALRTDVDVNTTTLNAALCDITSTDVNRQLCDNAAAIKGLLDEAEDIKSAKSRELAALQAEIDAKTKELEAKKSAMLAELEEKKSQMEAIKAGLEKKLFLLETEIYAIRCFCGEVINFTQLKSGSPCDIEEPITLFQKVRYLDEEMGKLISLYDFDFNDTEYFEQFLVSNNEAVDTFCPNRKCVSLVRISKTNRAFAFNHTPYGTMLEKYQKYHGKTIGILIRNGDNVYIGWTDESKINIVEDMFYTPSIKVVDERDDVKTDTKESIASRYFVFSILQGVLEFQKMISLPVKCNLSKPSKYVIFSTADAWLCDNRFGSFYDILNKTQILFREGNYILMWRPLSDGHFSHHIQTFNYERDRNECHRTHDVHVSDCTIYRINLVDKMEEEIKYTYKRKNDAIIYNTIRSKHNPPTFDDSVTILSEEPYIPEEYYISLVKDCSRWDVYDSYEGYHERKREARANFKVYPEEFIDLTFLNTTYIRYVIMTRNLGLGHEKSDYAHVIKYLNKALEFLIEREKEEVRLISPHFARIEEVPDWQIHLSDWKIANKVTNFTEWQAKRFAKHLKEM